MEKFRFVRNLFGVSQADVAMVIGVPQPTYAKYESGRTKKIPFGIVKRFANYYGIDVGWFQDELVSDEFRKTIRQSIDLIQDYSESYKRLGVPTAFLEAIRDEKIIPCEAFIKNIQREYLKAKEYIVEKDDETGETNEVPESSYPQIIGEQTKEIVRLKKTIDHLNAYIAVLEEKLDHQK